MACGIAALLAVVVGSGCQVGDPAAPAMLTPTVTLSRQNVPLGTPIEMTYRFVVAKDAKFTTNYHVMVHFGDQQDEQLMYTDDHDPPTPTTTWKPGQTIEYTRTFFTPTYPYIGTATVEIGLYAPGEKLRVPMAAEDTGHRSYKVATFELQPQTEGVQTIYKEGFHPVEGATPAVELRHAGELEGDHGGASVQCLHVQRFSVRAGSTLHPDPHRRLPPGLHPLPSALQRLRVFLRLLLCARTRGTARKSLRALLVVVDRTQSQRADPSAT